MKLFKKIIGWIIIISILSIIPIECYIKDGWYGILILCGMLVLALLAVLGINWIE